MIRLNQSFFRYNLIDKEETAIEEQGKKQKKETFNGKVIGGKYIIREQLGQGGSGRVYRAYDSHLQCDVAVKEFERENGISSKELTILKELRHPALPLIRDYLEEGESSYLIMEYIEGINLEEYIRRQQRIPEQKAVDWAKKLAEVLIYLHERERPVVYRDMKPSNIMIDRKGELWLVDFGTAYLQYHEGREAFVQAGTHGYAAPELFQGKGRGEVDERSDIYGLGATLFHLLTGCNPALPPYLIQPLRTYDRCLSPRLERIVKKATEEEKEKRYQTVRQMKEELESYRRADRRRKGIKRLVQFAYGICLFLLTIFFINSCMETGIFAIEWLPGKLLNSRLRLLEIEPDSQAVRKVLRAALFIFAACTAREAVRGWQDKDRREVKQGRSLLLTAKQGKGLLLSTLAGMLTLAALDTSAWAREEELTVHVKNRQGQKILIRYGVEYSLDGSLKLELPIENFEPGESYELELECVELDTGERRNRTFYLKRTAP
ncbi:MAG: serine/threonine protein kinase [Lachnospiraceae bacterium]|nr:serine/threonine protein kinase [Lachnospiraceae bacterium]